MEKYPILWCCMVHVESPNLYILYYTLYLHIRPGPGQEHPRTCHAMSFVRSNQPKGFAGSWPGSPPPKLMGWLLWWLFPHLNLPGQIPGPSKTLRQKTRLKLVTILVEGPYQAHMTWGNTDPVPVLYQFQLPRIHLHSTQYQDQTVMKGFRV